jgi:mannose-6-phosphate isomerase-like protein (cupin superfamily)
MTSRPVLHTEPTDQPLSVLLRGADADDGLALIDEMVADGFGPALHIHDTFDEGFYVLAGQLTFQVHEKVVAGGAGAFIWVPRGTPHTFANLSGHPARTLVLCAPAGFESHFDRLLASAVGSAPPAERSPAELGTRTVGTTIAEAAVNSRSPEALG